MEYLINLLIEYDSAKYINLFLVIVGTLYVSLILLRGFIMAVVSATKTEKDNKIVNKIYNFIDTYSLSFDKLINYSKIKEQKKLTNKK